MKNIFKQAKGFTIGVLVTILAMSGVTVLANAVTRQITVTSGHINLVIDGKAVIPRDAEGNVVEPFVHEGTTFLPVRAIADALGMDVRWDGDTSTVHLDRVTQITQRWQELDITIKAIGIIDSVLSMDTTPREAAGLLYEIHSVTDTSANTQTANSIGWIVAMEDVMITLGGLEAIQGEGSQLSMRYDIQGIRNIVAEMARMEIIDIVTLNSEAEEVALEPQPEPEITITPTLTVAPMLWTAPSTASTRDLTISTNQAVADVNVSSNATWLTISGTGNTRTMAVAANTGTSRTASITISVAGQSRVIPVTQQAAETSTPAGGITHSSYLQIRDGMTMSEVQAIIGVRHTSETVSTFMDTTTTMRIWTASDFRTSITVFFTDGRVSSKIWTRI